MMTAAQIASFWARVDKSAPDDHWLWTGYRERLGYGLICLTVEGEPLQYPVHRVAWELHYGSLPRQLRNRCGVLHCCNPAHWHHRCDGPVTRTLAQVQGHSRRGLNRRVFSDQTIAQLRAAYARGAKQADLAREFHMSQGYVSVLVRQLERRSPSGGQDESS